MKHRLADGAKGDEKEENQKKRGDTGQRDKDDHEKKTANKKYACGVTIGKIPDRGLDNEGQYSAATGNQPDLRHVECESLNEQRKQRINEGCIKVSDEMDEG